MENMERVCRDDKRIQDPDTSPGEGNSIGRGTQGASDVQVIVSGNPGFIQLFSVAFVWLEHFI